MKHVALLLVTSMLFACGSDDEPSPTPTKTDTSGTTPDPIAAIPVDPGVAAPPVDQTAPTTPVTPSDPTPSDPSTTPTPTPPAGDPYSPPTTPANPTDPWTAVDPNGSGGFTPGWRLLGSYTFGGFSTSFSVPTGVGTIGHVVLEAPASCAPQLTQAYVATNLGYVPVWFQAQRTVYPNLQALLVVGNGTPTFASSLTLGFASTSGATCPITVYAVGN